ncbi:MAG: hypothetical protein ACU0GG_15545 [Paracoccaceae bacterium]
MFTAKVIRMHELLSRSARAPHIDSGATTGSKRVSKSEIRTLFADVFQDVDATRVVEPSATEDQAA